MILQMVWHLIPVIQEELIEEYLKDFQPEDELLKRVIKLNSKYNIAAESQEEVGRNVNWKLESFEWDNLFNYGPDNKINFNKFNGIVGIFGKNFSGKSSIVDSLLYTLFNSTSKNERKNLNIINQNKNHCMGKVKISIGNKKYTIHRTSEKYIKKLKGEETLEAKTDLNFECYDEALEETCSLNGLTRNETDKFVRKYFGTLDDFLLTSMSSQLGALQFISEGSTRRKEILAKFLDLEMFEKKFKMAKEDATDLRGALKRLEGKEFDQDIFEVEKELILNEAETKEQTQTCEEIKGEISILCNSVLEVQNNIDSIPTEIINIQDITVATSEKEIQSTELTVEIIETNEQLFDNREFLTKINEFIDTFDINTLQKKKENTTEKIALLNKISDELCVIETSFIVKTKKKQLLEEVPCGDEYPNCKFICDAHTASNELFDLIKKVKKLNNTADKINEEIEILDPENKMDEHLEKYYQLLNKKTSLETNITNLKLVAEKNDISYKSLEKEIEDLYNKSEEYHKNKDIIENKGSFIKKLEKINKRLSSKQEELKKCEEFILNLYKLHGSLEQKLTSLQDQKKELENLREEYSAYDLFMRCMHSSGISYGIIKKKLPVINNEIAKVLANIVNFEIFFEDDGKHLKIFIKHPKHEPRPMDMGSGAEKTIAAMAIRLSLLSVSSLPKSNIFILDEPGTALDAENMDGFVSILELVKSYFKTVFLISHLDSLKDCVDMQITINKNGDYANVLET